MNSKLIYEHLFRLYGNKILIAEVSDSYGYTGEHSFNICVTYMDKNGLKNAISGTYLFYETAQTMILEKLKNELE